jgi:uncharacterized protein YbjT (DUF2867 family)
MTPVTADAAPMILLTGATGYIGGRLAPRLLAHGYRIRCFTRSRAKLLSRPWASDPRVEVVEGDANDEVALRNALRGCQAAYFLIHSMDAAGHEYRERDLAIAESFGRAAAAAGVARILYLGGLGDGLDALSEHLASRREVEAALGVGGVPVTVLRAAMIIGSGSASFEILRYLVERLPIMITPRWVRTEAQPISVRDVLHYLIAALEAPATAGLAIDIGGPDIWSYERMMKEMARALGLKARFVIPVPVLTPKLSALWIHLITPLGANIAQPLAEGLRNRVVVRNDDAQRLMPHQCRTIPEAMAAAVARYESGTVESSWSDAGPIPGDPDWAGGTQFMDERATTVDVPVEAVWQEICAIGGERGYYTSDILWHLRGILDRMLGGPGLRRGRRNPTELRMGDAVDFWRVTAIEPGKRLELTAEMLLPGVATLTLSAAPASDGGTRLALKARFRPRGLFGIAYWYAVYPLHGIVFPGMLRGIAREARLRAAEAHAAQERAAVSPPA